MVCLGPVSLPFESWVQARAPDRLLTVRSNDQETSTVRSGSSRVSLPVPSRTRSTEDLHSPLSTGRRLPRSLCSSHSRPPRVYGRLLPPASCSYGGEHGPSGDGRRRHGDECGGNEATCSPHQQHPAAARGGLVLACYPQGSSLPLLLLFLYCPSLRNGCLQDV